MNGVELHRNRVAAVASDYPLRDVLLVSIFALYPFHTVLDVVFAANLSYADPVIALVLGLWLVGALGAVRAPRYSAILAFLGAATLLSLAVNALSPPSYFSLHRGFVAFTKLLGSVAWFVATFALLQRNPRHHVAVAAAISVAVATAFAVVALHDAVAFASHRQSGPFQNPNLFGNYLVFNACLGLALRRSPLAARWPGWEWLVLGPVGLIASGIVTTGSRGSLLAAALAGGWIAASAVQFSRRDGLLAAGAVVATAGGASMIVWLAAPSLAGRFLSTENLSGRLNLWRTAVDAFQSSPLFGIGYGQYQEFLVSQGGREIGAHNTYLLYAAETGLLGLVVLLGLLATVVRDAFRTATAAPTLRYLLAFVVGTAGQALVTDVNNFRSLWIAVGAIAAFVAIGQDRTLSNGDRVGDRSASDRRPGTSPGRFDH
jgi:O-antigen ligase